MWTSWPSIRSKPLRLEFEIPISRTHKFWEMLEKGEIHTTKCKECRSLHFPPVADCPKCGSSEMDWVRLDGYGELEAFTHVIARPASFHDQEPYTIAIGRLEDGVKVLAWLKGVDIADIRVGMKLKLEAGVTSEGEAKYWFIPG